MYECKVTGKLKCGCKHKEWGHKSEWEVGRHVTTPTHVKWFEDQEKKAQQQSLLGDYKSAKSAEETGRLQLVGTRLSSLSEESKEFCEATVKAFSRAGIPLNKLGGPLKDYLSKYSQLTLAHPTDLARDCVPKLLEEETELQRMELRDKIVSIIYDATPRQGDAFACVARFMEVDPKLRTAFARHVLIHVSTIKGSLNATTLSAEVSTALANREIRAERVPAAAMDRCFTNSASATEMNDCAAVVGKLQRFTVFCFAHMTCNAGDCASFVLLELFWTYLQKVFAQSTAAQDEWRDVTGFSWPTYSETRWFSLYEVLEKISDLFPDLLTVMTRVATKKISPANSSKLLNLLLDPLLGRKLKIVLAAYVEGLNPLRNLCYWIESDATDIAFRVGQRIEEFKGLFPGGSMMNLPKTNRLIMEVSSICLCLCLYVMRLKYYHNLTFHISSMNKFIEWATRPTDEGGGGYTAPALPAAAPPTPPVTVAQIDRQVNAAHPRRPTRAAAAGVSNAVRALESVQAQRQREEREAQAAAAEAAASAQVEAEREAARVAALEQALRDEADRPPLTPDEWKAEVMTGLLPAIEYIMVRISEGGDRYDAMQFYFGARIFDPSYAKTLSRAQAFALIDKMSVYPIFNKGGDNSIINRLKKTWSAYHKNASEVQAKFGNNMREGKDKAGISTWHYKMFLRLDTEVLDDAQCRYCTSGNKHCGCYNDIKVWWEACELAALVLPSSGTSERVFSMLSNMFGDKQGSLLSDALQLGLMLAFNKREV